MCDMALAEKYVIAIYADDSTPYSDSRITKNEIINIEILSKNYFLMVFSQPK